MKTAVLTFFAALGFAASCAADVSNLISAGGIEASVSESVKNLDIFKPSAGNALNFKIFENCDNSGAENFVLYPKGVREVLKVALLSSSGGAQAELEKVLGVKKSELLENLKSGKSAPANSEEFAEANLFLASDKFKKNEKFSDELKKYFGAEVMVCDFSKPQKTADFVNDWVKENTRSMIEGALRPSDVSALTSVIIANAAVFDAKWKAKFKEKDTSVEKFKTAQSGLVEVNMMHIKSKEIAYSEVGDFKAVKIPYKGGNYFFVGVLPLDEESAAFPPAEEFAALWNCFADVEVDLYMPKFEFETGRVDLKQTLENLGARSVFEWSGENFSEFFDEKVQQKIDKFFQKVLIKVDEEGTKAAAFTGMISLGYASVSEKAVFRADRPFSFFIVDKNGKILFMGRVGNPAKYRL
ncbi:MAG: serpin family protein [Opitutales bacterium]|nr:serpin family protein [Opitutales bacterium]